ncbi:hypothetical protein ACO0LM_03190 [Undibacterium sp. Di26W]|uniref:hypothetical protein n=1 Tax=Undibacterium sp. Di26W TaxID=3413035 RepID=UPI003BF44B0D
MLKKSIVFCVLTSALLGGLAYSQELMSMASVPSQYDPQDKSANPEIMPEAPSAATPQAQVQLDRSGVDRASVHLQILQQTNMHFSDNVQPAPAPQPKKTVAEDKKAQAKSASST